MRSLRKAHPRADIRFLTKRTYADLVVANPNLNGVFFLDEDLRSVISQVKEFRPDVIIDLHNNLRSLLVKASVGTASYSFSKLNVEKWLQVNLSIDSLPNVHIVDRYMKTVEKLGAINDDAGLDFFIPENVQMPSLGEVFEKGYIALVVGAKFATKRIPEGKLRALVERLDFPVVLIGGPEDAACGQRLTIRADVFNACGKFSLLQSARLLQHARLVITPDTGMMHIASAFHRPIISIWGSTIPEFGMAPYMPLQTDHHSILEQKGLSCRPCSKLGFSKCPRGHFKCMEQLETQTIITTLNKILIK